MTTGTTATAAATAALLTLLNEESYSEVMVTLPQGERIPFPIQQAELTAQGARAVAVKDAGSDPDAVSYTHLDVYKRQGIPRDRELGGRKYLYS